MVRKRFAALAMSVLVLTGTATAVPLLVSGEEAGASTTTQFTTPGCSVYTVPPLVNQIQMDAYGAQGGSSTGGGGLGGLGGHAGGLLNVSPGQGLEVCVGGQGNGVTPGINGGGKALGSSTSPPAGASGGGASDVRTGAFGISERVLVAGGGGGAASVTGGAGGGTSGSGCGLAASGCGEGGSQMGGGAGGAAPASSGCLTITQVTPSHPGTVGIGGDGGDASAVNTCPFIVGTATGGGGGGGYYGGGGGNFGSSGGGGSGFVASSIQATGAWVNTAGVRSGNGEVDIAATVSAFAIGTTSLPGATRSVAYGPVTLTAVNVAASASPFVTTLKWGKVPLATGGKIRLPYGLKLTRDGVLSGTPNSKLTPGASSITVQVTEKVTTFNGTKKVVTKTTAQATIPLTIN